MTEISMPPNPSLWRRATAAYAKLLEILLAACVGILVIPVTLQIISRYTPRGTVLVFAVLLYLASWMIPDNRVREMVLTIGLLRMLGFLGLILGIVDAVRERKPPAVNSASPPPTTM